MSFHVPESFRVVQGRMASSPKHGNNGAFVLPIQRLHVIASDGKGWEHVSVNAQLKTPTWEQMCFIKNLFWDEDDVVMQLHPAKKDWVNNHNNVLHLWRPTTPGVTIPLPAPILVGIPGVTPEDMRRVVEGA